MLDSQEELWICYWLDELQAAGIVLKWERTELPIPLTPGLVIPYSEKKVLKTKIKYVDKKKILLRPSEYTPDFKVWFGATSMISSINGLTFNPEALLFIDVSHYPVCFLEVKNGFFDAQNMTRLFINNQKFVYDKHQIYVNLIDPVSLFENTFLPSKCIEDFKYKRNPTGKHKGKRFKGDWKVDFEPKTLQQFLK